MWNKMSIADLLKYAEFLTKRLEEVQKKIRQVEVVKIGSKVVWATASWNVVETTDYAICPGQLMSEFDKTGKELRLVKQTIERLNHSTVVEFVQAF